MALNVVLVVLSDREVREIREMAEKANVMGERIMPAMIDSLFADTI